MNQQVDYGVIIFSAEYTHLLGPCHVLFFVYFPSCTLLEKANQKKSVVFKGAFIVQMGFYHQEECPYFENHFIFGKLERPQDYAW
jgi:hypothetical protein